MERTEQQALDTDPASREMVTRQCIYSLQVSV